MSGAGASVLKDDSNSLAVQLFLGVPCCRQVKKRGIKAWPEGGGCIIIRMSARSGVLRRPIHPIPTRTRMDPHDLPLVQPLPRSAQGLPDLPLFAPQPSCTGNEPAADAPC